MRGPTEFDQFADNYDECLNQALAASGEGKEYFARGRVEWLARCLGEDRPRPRSVLDYGCGTGDTATLLRELLQSESVLGLDVSQRSLERAERDHGSSTCRFIKFSEYQPDGSVDLAYCNGVFHHIPVGERAAAVDYIYRCLQPGGIFALWENNPWNPGTRYVMYRCDFDRDAVKLSPTEAAGLLRNGGFEVLRTDYRFFFPRFLKALRSMETWLSRVPLGGQYQVLVRKPSRK
ncbi:MAG: class I SAM-dependent methyltransferase [Terriglobales bacterium]